MIIHNGDQAEFAGRPRDINEPFQLEYLDMARGAIEAMREPTVDMLVAAQEEWLCVRAAEERGDFIWRAMIDNALISQDGGEK